jgi:putative transcriptional regulator
MIVLKLDVMLKKRDLTAYALHRKTGLHQSVISKIRHGKTIALRLDVLDKICAALECQAGDLIVYQGADATRIEDATQSVDATRIEKPTRIRDASRIEDATRSENLPVLPDDDKWLSLEEAGAILGKKRKTVNDDVRKGRLSAVQNRRGHNFVKESDVIAFRDGKSGNS